MLFRSISWLQSPSAVILEPRKIKSATVSTVSPSICHEVPRHDEDLREPLVRRKPWLTLFFGAPKSLQMAITFMKLKDTYSLEEKLPQPRRRLVAAPLVRRHWGSAQVMVPGRASSPCRLLMATATASSGAFPPLTGAPCPQIRDSMSTLPAN